MSEFDEVKEEPFETPPDPFGKKSNDSRKISPWLIGGIILFFICVAVVFAGYYGYQSIAGIPADPNATNTPVVQATKTVQPTATSAFDNSRPTNTPLPTSTAQPGTGPTQPVGATATPFSLVNPTQTVIPQVWEMLTWHDTVPQTPCPDCGPYVDPTEAPTVPVLAMENDARDFIRLFINEYVRYMNSQGRRPILYHVVNDIFPWIPVAERDMGEKWSVTTEGGTWYDCSFPKGGCKVSGMGESVFTADLATCYADASVSGVVPFYPNSTMGGYGAMETVVDEEVSFILGNGVLYVPEGSGLTVTQAGGSCQ